MEYTLSMTFINMAGDKISLSISGVKPEITQSQTSALMNLIIDKDIFTSDGGQLTGKYSAQLTERTVTKFEVQ